MVLKADTSQQRFDTAQNLLNFGFANYTLLDVQPGAALPPVTVLLGEQSQVQPAVSGPARVLVERDKLDLVTTQIRLAGDVEAPVEEGQILGELVVLVDGQERQSIPLVARSGVERISVGGIFSRLLRALLLAG